MSKSANIPSFLALGWVGAFAFATGAHTQDVAQGQRLGGMTVTDAAIDFILASNNAGEQTIYAAYLFDTMKIADWFEINGDVRYEKVKGFNRTFSYVTTAGAANLGAISTVSGPFRTDDNLFSYPICAVFKPSANSSLYIAYRNSKLPSKVSVDGSCSALTCNVKPETPTS